MAGLVDDFDFAVNEQCHQYNECESLTPFTEQNKAVFNAEIRIFGGTMRRPVTFCVRLNVNLGLSIWFSCSNSMIVFAWPVHEKHSHRLTICLCTVHSSRRIGGPPWLASKGTGGMQRSGHHFPGGLPETGGFPLRYVSTRMADTFLEWSFHRSVCLTSGRCWTPMDWLTPV